MANIFKPPCDEGVLRCVRCAAPCPESSRGWILAATIIASSMVFIDGSAVNVALPALQADLNATATDFQWIVESYALFLAALLLVGGSLGDRFGRRRIFAAGVALFALASAWCGLAPDAGQLILARAAQGLGGALLVVAGLYQVSPFKQACLRHCRSPVHFIVHRRRAGTGGAFAITRRRGPSNHRSRRRNQTRPGPRRRAIARPASCRTRP